MPNVKDSSEYCNVSKIHGFEDLFGPPPRDDTIRSIRFGSKLLLSGPPGAGKTTFALATVRAMMIHARETKREERVIAYYISSEVDEQQLLEDFEAFGWFEKGARHEGSVSLPFKFSIDNQVPDQTNFYAITPMPEIDRPVPSPEELVNGIFNRIAHTLLPAEAPSEGAKIYVIIDSITALLKGCADAGEERRQTHEIMRRLQDKFDPESLALIVLLAEQDYRSLEAGGTSAPVTPTEASVEDYLSDMVFRLYVRSMALGRRARILEVVKSQGANMTLGEHTWQIVTEANYTEILRDEDFQNRIKTEAGSQGNKPIWGNILIFPRLRLQLEPQTVPIYASQSTGTDKLQLNIAPGTITLIVGPMASFKTTLCTNFLTEGMDEERKRRRVLISFDVPAASIAGGQSFKRLHFTQSQFDLNVLLAHINFLLEQECDRVAFDGLSDWITMFDRPEAARVLEALMVTIKRRGPKAPSVFMSYEMPLREDPFAPAALGTAADNIVVIRPVPINDETRRVIYVLKRQGKPTEDDGPTHSHPGELRWNEHNKLVVDTYGLEAYTGLLSPKLEVQRARALLQLFAENLSEKEFNDGMVKKLRGQLNGRIDITATEFSLSEIGSTLDSAFGAGNPGEAFNLSIHTVDEWWLAAGNTSDFVRDLGSREKWRKLSPKDFWWFEVEKATSSEPLKGPKDRRRINAVPAYMDFGMFCVDLAAMNRDYSHQERGEDRDRWQALVSEIPRRWVESDGAWFKVDATIASEFNTVLDYALKVTGQTARENEPARDIMRRKPVFTFDSSTRESCACMFLEMAWAFGGTESLLGEPTANNQAAVRQALRFFQFMVMEGLLPPRCTAESRNHGNQPILFSRQWYSSLRRQTEPKKSGETPPRSSMIALPFMPAGASGIEEMVRSLLNDIATRQFYWARRAEDYAAAAGLTKPLQGKWESFSKAKSALQDALAKTEPIRKIVRLALAAYRRCRDWLLAAAALPSIQNLEKGQPNSGHWNPDLDDLMELAAWAALRLSLLLGSKGGKISKIGSKSDDAAGQGLYLTRWVRYYLPDFQSYEARRFDPANAVATGYVCSGSWMYSVGRNSRSSEIQAQILAELASLDNAEERARLGAGIPARKDFFYLNGEKPVTGMDYLNWRELLRLAGSRSRRRDRALIPRSVTEAKSRDPSPLYNVIQQEMLACLRIADLYRQQYADGTGRNEAIEAVIARSEEAVQAIYAEARKI